MIWDRRLHALIPDNPLVARDLRRLQRTTSLLKGNLETVGVVTVALGFSVAMLYSVVSKLDWSRPYYTYYEDYRLPIQRLAWIFHAAVVLRMLAAGVFCAARDGYLLDSDDLMLTPLSNWQLVIAKWWVAMHQVRGWMLALGIVQLGIVVSTVFGLLTTVAWRRSCGGGIAPCVDSIQGLVYQPSWYTPLWLLFVVDSAIWITVLETVCCTALGITVAIVVRSKLGLFAAIASRFAPVLIFSFFPNYPWAYGINLMNRYFYYTWFSFADGGTGALILWGDLEPRGLPALCAVLGMFLVYLSLSLVTVAIVMRRSRR